MCSEIPNRNKQRCQKSNYVKEYKMKDWQGYKPPKKETTKHNLNEAKKRYQAPVKIIKSDGSATVMTAFDWHNLNQEGKQVRGGGENFTMSQAWREVRYKVLRKYGGRCMLCGRSAKDGVRLHVDHIKPRAKHPALALDPNNLQVLCEDCNCGKGAKFADDWRNH